MTRRGPKRNKHQKAQDIKRASELRLEGLSLRQIGKEVGLDEKQVRLDLAFIDNQLLEQAEEDRKRDKANQLAKLRWAQLQCRDAWLRSLEDAEKTSLKESSKGGIEQTVATEGRSGNPGHMANYAKFVSAETDLLKLLEKEPGGQEELSELEEMLVDCLISARMEYGSSQNLPVQSGAVSIPDPIDSEDQC